MTKRKLEWGKYATISFEFSWRAPSPHLFDIVEVIGKEETISRIQVIESL
jgi:hypothetical protein